MNHELMRPDECHRLQGRSMLDGDGCRCFLAAGFLECPPEARTVPVTLACAQRIVTRSRMQPRRNVQRSGDFCDNCGGANIVRTGTCLTCVDCGSTSGGCS